MKLHCVLRFLISHQLSRADTRHLLWPEEQSDVFWQVRGEISMSGMGFSLLLLLSPSQLLEWLSQLMEKFWAPNIFSSFHYFLLVQYNHIQPLTANFSSPTTMKRTSRDINSGLCLFFQINIMMQLNNTWLHVVWCSVSHGQQKQPCCWMWHEVKRQTPARGRSPCLSAQPGDLGRH